MSKAADTKSRILRGAEDVIIRDGVGRLTLEAAAQEAGVSKGGVLYHFPSRAALVAAMVDRFVVTFDTDLDRYGARSGEPGAFVRAYLEATVAPTLEPGDIRDRRISGALLAGVASDADLLRPLRARFDAWQRAVDNDGIDPAIATLVRVAADGLWLCDLFDLAPIAGERRRALADELRRLIDDAVARGGSSVAASDEVAAAVTSDEVPAAEVT